MGLFRCTPNLRKLNIIIDDTSDNEQFPFFIPLLTKLKISYTGEYIYLFDFVKNLSNLSELIIEINDVYIDGYQWEEIIRNNLSKLKIFHLLMFCNINYEKNFKKKIDQLFESFQTKFWIDEHQWFIRCDYHSENETVHLYTLPYGFEHFYDCPSKLSKSTYPFNQNYHLFTNINMLILDDYLLKFASDYPIQFSNIKYLHLSFPFDQNLWLIIPTFHRLISLRITSISHPDKNDRSFLDLHLLIHSAINLYSLTVDYFIMSQLSLESIKNISIRRLDLTVNDGHFYSSECILLIQSLLGDQCEILLINIENQSIVIDLINKMPHLRALIFQCQDDQWIESLSTEDDTLQWLQSNLPSNCLVKRDENEISTIRLWIR